MTDTTTHTPNNEKPTTEKLEALLYQFITLYERWSEDRQTMVYQHANVHNDLKALITTLSKHLDEFREFEPTLQAHFARKLQAAVDDLGKSLNDSIHQATMHKVNGMVQSLNETVRF